MASLTGDGAERPEGAVPAASPPTPPTAGGDRADAPVPTASAAAAAPAVAAPTTTAGGAEVSATPALPPPMAVPTVRVKPDRPVKGITTASDYVAPRELPAHTPQPVETAAAKVVIHVPDAGKADEASSAAAPSEAEVAELRQRRRAPTLKIDRNAVKELKALDDARAAAAVAQIIEAVPAPSARTTAVPLVTDARRPLARAAAERPSPRRTGWIVALGATAVVGAGALAVGLGWVPGLAPVEEPPAAADPRGADLPTGQEGAATSVPEPATAPAPSATEAASASPSASASGVPLPSASGAGSAPSAPSAPAAATAPRPAPWPGGRPPRPRPKTDIPSGI